MAGSAPTAPPSRELGPAGSMTRLAGPSARVTALWLSALLVLALIWVAGVLVPSLLGDVGGEAIGGAVRGDTDPAGPWLAPGADASVTWLALLLVVPLLVTPVAAGGSVLASGALLFAGRGRQSTRVRRLLVGVFVVALVLSALTLSPLGEASMSWALD